MHKLNKAPRYRWDLSQTPNYDNALCVEEVLPDGLTARTFHQEYTVGNRPCLIKGAISSWKATREWSKTDYLRKLCAGTTVKPRTKPQIEVFGVGTPQRERCASERSQRDAAALASMPFEEFLTRATNARSEVLYAVVESDQQEFRHLEHDFTDFPFLYERKKSPFYCRWAVMFYKNSYADWHFHKFTEALLCQIKGTKEVLLLPSDRDTWSQFAPVNLWKCQSA